jgi:hypothetical protein
MLRVNYNLSIGNWSVNSANDPRTEFIEVETYISLDSPCDLCRVSVYAPPPAKPGLLESLAGPAAGTLGLGGAAGQEKFSVQIRGKDVKEDDQITIELTSGDVSDKIMTAEVQTINSSLGQTRITGKTGRQKMANTCVNQVFENQSFSRVVKNLAGQAGVAAGNIDTGGTYPYLVVHESKNLYEIIRGLAMGEGMDVYFDTDNKLNIKKFNKTSADHTFYYGIDILDLQVFNCQMNKDHILVYGESPASKKGTDTWHWIAKDLSPFAGEIGEGGKTLSLHSGTVRTKDAADTLAASKYGAIKDSSAWGRLKIMGNPKVKPGDAIEIKNAVNPGLNGLFKVTSVSHVLNKQDGYLTYVGFTGSGGAKKAGGLMGGLAGALGF